MPTAVYLLSMLYLCSAQRPLVLRWVTIGYGGIVSWAAAAYRLHHDDALFQTVDLLGVGLSAAWAFSSYRTARLEDHCGESKV